MNGQLTSNDCLKLETEWLTFVRSPSSVRLNLIAQSCLIFLNPIYLCCSSSHVVCIFGIGDNANLLWFAVLVIILGNYAHLTHRFLWLQTSNFILIRHFLALLEPETVRSSVN